MASGIRVSGSGGGGSDEGSARRRRARTISESLAAFASVSICVSRLISKPRRLLSLSSEEAVASFLMLSLLSAARCSISSLSLLVRSTSRAMLSAAAIAVDSFSSMHCFSTLSRSAADCSAWISSSLHRFAASSSRPCLLASSCSLSSFFFCSVDSCSRRSDAVALASSLSTAVACTSFRSSLASDSATSRASSRSRAAATDEVTSSSFSCFVTPESAAVVSWCICLSLLRRTSVCRSASLRSSRLLFFSSANSSLSCSDQ